MLHLVDIYQLFFLKGVHIARDIQVIVVLPNLIAGRTVAILVHGFSGFVGADDSGNIAVPQDILVLPFFIVAFPGCINKQHIVPGTAFPEDQDASRNTGAVKQICRQTDHSIQQVHFNQLLADFSLAGATKQDTVGENNGHASVLGIQAMQHMQDKCVVTLRGRRYSPVEALPRIHVRCHFFKLPAFGVQTGVGKKTAVPLVQAEGWVCHHHLELHQMIVFNILRV